MFSIRYANLNDYHTWVARDIRDTIKTVFWKLSACFWLWHSFEDPSLRLRCPFKILNTMLACFSVHVEHCPRQKNLRELVNCPRVQGSKILAELVKLSTVHGLKPVWFSDPVDQIWKLTVMIPPRRVQTVFQVSGVQLATPTYTVLTWGFLSRCQFRWCGLAIPMQWPACTKENYDTSWHLLRILDNSYNLSSVLVDFKSGHQTLRFSRLPDGWNFAIYRYLLKLHV